ARVDRLQLGAHARFSLLGFGRLLPLLGQPLLGALQVVLLLPDLAAVALLRGRRRGSAEDRDRRDEDERAPPAHARACLVASNPPTAPSADPPPISARIWGSERNTARSMPSVTGSNGSSRGVASAKTTSSTMSASGPASNPWMSPCRNPGGRIPASGAPPSPSAPRPSG